MTLEDDVAERLAEESRRTGKSFKAVVNDAIRSGLDRRGAEPRSRYVVKARPMHAKPGIDFDCVWDLIERIEGPSFR